MSEENSNGSELTSAENSENLEKLVGEVEVSSTNYHELYDELFKKHQYLTAEVLNMKKRFELEKDRIYKQSQITHLSKIIDTVDIISLVIEHLDDVKAKETITSAVEQILLDYELKIHTQVGDHFDPSKHDAISTSEGNQGYVTKIFKKGYAHKDSIIRIALVEVGS